MCANRVTEKTKRVICFFFFAFFVWRTCLAGMVEDARGVAFQVGRYSRIVSLAPSVTEILFFLGLGERVVGVTRFCDYPEEAKRLPKVGGIADPDPEMVLSLAPDIVIATKNGNPSWIVTILEGMGIPCFVTDSWSVADIRETMEVLSVLLDAPQEGMMNLRLWKKKVDDVRETVPAEGVPVLLLLSSNPPVAAGRLSFLDEVLALSGGRNVLKGSSVAYPHVTLEEVIALSPEYVFVVTGMGEETSRGFISRLEEFSPSIRVEEVDGDLFTRPGPRVVDAILMLRRYLRGR